MGGHYHMVSGACAFSGLGEVSEATCLDAAKALKLPATKVVKGVLVNITLPGGAKSEKWNAPMGCTADLKNPDQVVFIKPQKNKDPVFCDGTDFSCLCEKASESRVKAEQQRWRGFVEPPITVGANMNPMASAMMKK